MNLTEVQLEHFSNNGYLILEKLAAPENLTSLIQAAQLELQALNTPIEYEADVGYPGAPISQDAQGGKTIRRLLRASMRQKSWLDWATGPVIPFLKDLFGSDILFLSQAHHNCLMTKHPDFGSETGWHQDIRYWAFSNQNLITAWLALDNETSENGSLNIIPGSHKIDFESDQFDRFRFFKTDHKNNQHILEQSRSIKLLQGDVLLFHARLLHSAGKNLTNNTKRALVFTYHDKHNFPLAGTRSSSEPEIQIN